jgi:flavodoxin
MKKYVSATLSLLLLASLLFAGCGINSTGSGAGNSSLANSSPASAAGSSESTAAAGKAGTDSAGSAAQTLSAADAKAVNGGSLKTGKVLVVYWSLTGNTKKLAGMIKDMTGGELFEIQPEFDYLSVKSRTEMENLGKKQVDEGFQPELKTKVENIGQYDLIFVGSPVWWYSVTPPVMSFLTKENLKGKKVVPFCTCGSAYGDFFSQFKSAIPDSNYMEGISVTDSELANETELKNKVGKWLKSVSEEAAK